MGSGFHTWDIGKRSADSLNQAERDIYLKTHIPYRMTSVDGMRYVCGHLAAFGEGGPIQLHLPPAPTITSPTIRILSNPVIEVGAIYCRVLLEFLGLGLEDGQLAERTNRRGDDVGIEDFDLPRVTLADLDAVASDHSDIRAYCATTVYVAHKAIAHLTNAPVDLETIPHVHDCGLATLRLMERHLYEALGRPVPDYRQWPLPRPRPDEGNKGA